MTTPRPVARRLALTAAALLIAATSAGLAGGQAAASSWMAGRPTVALGSPGAGPDGPATPQDVIDIGSRIDTLMDQSPDRWGGAWVDGDQVVVNVADGTLDEAAAILAKAGITTSVRLVAVEDSLTDLDSHAQEVGTVLRSSPGSATSFGPTYSRSQIVVGLLDDDAALRAALAQLPLAVNAYSDQGTPEPPTR